MIRILLIHSLSFTKSYGALITSNLKNGPFFLKFQKFPAVTHNQNPPIPNNNMTENNSNNTNIFKSCPGNSNNPFFGLPGTLRVAQFLFGLISWSIVVSIPYWNSNFYGGYNSSLVYGAAIQIIFWIFDFFLIIIFSLKLQERINITAYNLALSELILNSLASFLIFVGAICIATYGGGKYGWAAAFAFLNCFCWGGSALLAFWRWQNNGGSIKCGNGSS